MAAIADFLDENFSANSYNVVVGAVNAVRNYFGDRGVSSSLLLDYGNITGCKEAVCKHTRLDDPLITSQWEGLSVRSLRALVAQYVVVLRESVPGIVYPRADEYTSKFLRELTAKLSKQSGEPRSPRASPAKKMVEKTKKADDSRD